MPLDPISVLVVEDCKTSLIVKLLKAVDSESTRILHVLELAGLQTLVVVRLSLARRDSPAPECESAWDIGRWDSLVSVGPEPSVDVDRLQLSRITALVPEVALPPRRPDRAYIVPV